MWNILLGFLPWILFSALYGKSTKEIIVSTTVAMAVFLLTERKFLWKGFILSWGTVCFFCSVIVFAIILKNTWFLNNIWFVSNAALALIIWFSLLIKRPFTLQYARETTPKQCWNKPGFLRVNLILTIMWGALLTTTALISLIPFNKTNVAEEIVYQVVSYGAILLGVWLNKKIPTQYRQYRQKINNKNNPFLQGNFAPIHEENDFTNLTVEGKIPADLAGIYMRNGPNPAFEPISYTYPFDGDGMIHALYFDKDAIQYKNRYVQTKGLQLEKRYNKAIYGGIANPLPLDPKIVGPNDDPSPFKDGAFIHIIKHAERYLAMYEGAPAYEITEDLSTIGEWTAGMDKALNAGPHTRLDPETGDLYLINYDLTPPYLVYHRVDSSGVLQESRIIEKPYATMMHDFVMTKNYLVIFDCPILFNEQAMLSGGNILSWRSDLPVRIGLINRKDNNVKPIWLEVPAFFVFHFANAYEENNTIIVDFARHQKLQIATGETKDKPPVMHRMIINLDNFTTADFPLGSMMAEFPVFNLNYNTKPYRYIYAASDLVLDYFNALIKFDLKTNSQEIHQFAPQYEIGEPVYVPKPNAQSEDDGYIMLYGYDKSRNTSDLIILDAQKITQAPIAKINLPQRVPNGLHGSWFAKG